MKCEQWDDFRIVLTVARAGTLSAASAALGVDPTTVSRRVRAIEERIGQTLFDRLRGGVETSAFGAAFVETAEQLEQQIFDFERRVNGEDLALEGRVCVAISELVAQPMIPDLAAFSAAHPGLDVQLLAGNELTDLSKREADIAVRATRAPAEHLVGRKVAPLALGIYGVPRFAEMPREAWTWVGWNPTTLDESATERWRQEHGGGDYALFANSYLLLLEACQRGAGVALLPYITGQHLAPEIVPLTEFEPQRIPIWLLTHPDLRHSARIRAVLDWLADWFREHQSDVAPA